jgi:hypothetical protein
MPYDFSRYVTLRDFDVSPTDIYFDAIEYGRLALPEFQLRQGTPEDAILQAISYISSLNIAAINRLPDRLMSGILGMMGVTANEGARATIDVVFTCIDYDGTSIPAGTVIRYDYENLGQPISIYFETAEEGIIDPVTYTGTEPLPSTTIECRALDVGVILPIGQGLEFSIDTPTSNIVSATLDSILTYGSNPETSDEYLERAVQYLGSLSSSFARASQIDGFALSQFTETVSRCKTYDLTDPAGDQLWETPAEVGHVTVYVYGIGRLPTEDEKVDLLLAIQARTVAGLEVGVNPVTLAELSLVIEAGYSSEYEATIVEENLQSVISQYFSPENYRFTDSIKMSEFYALASSVPGVIFVPSISVTSEDGNSSSGASSVDFPKKGTLPYMPFQNVTVALTSVDI